MREYNQTIESDELYHYGVKGMRWGVIRTIARKRSSSSKKRAAKINAKGKYKVTKTDVELYGERGAKRIAKRKANGDSAKKARSKELAMKIAKNMAGATVASLVAADINTGGELHKGLINTGKAFVNKAMDSYFNTSVIDASGKIIKRYRSKVNVADAVSRYLLRGG